MGRKKNYDATPEPQRQTRQLKILTENQQITWDLLHEKQIVFLIGPPGTGKTFLPSAFAALEIRSGKRENIILTRPGVTADNEDWGFLPGELEEKMEPFLVPIYESYDKIFGKNNANRQEIKKAFKLAPLAFCRGRTFDNSVAILDEAQNVTINQMEMWLSRQGQNCTMVITGDPNQRDIRDSYLEDIAEEMSDLPYVGVVKFGKSDIVRSKNIAEVCERINRVRLRGR